MDWRSWWQRKRRRRQWSNCLGILVTLLHCSLLIQSINGQSHRFRDVRTSFSEGAIVGTRRLLEVDSLGTRVGSFHIVAGNEEDTFRLHQTYSDDDASIVNFIHLETTTALDREHRSQYILTISADLLDTSASSTFRVFVTVLDINDNPPMFQQSEYEVSVNKSAPPGSSLITVSAVDKDAEGKNSRLSYHLEDMFSTHFSLNRETGTLSTSRQLECRKDEEACPGCLGAQKSSCSILIYAKDGGLPQQSAYTVVKVRVLEANDHDPDISFRYLPDQSRPYAVIEENIKAGTSVAAVTVTDKDAGVFGEAKLEMVDGNRGGHFTLDAFGSNLYVVRVANNARIMSNNVYNITVRATDMGNPPRSTFDYLVIKVNEVNDHEPEFEQSVYTVSVAEDARVGSQVVVVRAEDPDSAGRVNTVSKLVYTISEGNELAWFRLHPLSGMITTKAALDRERQDQFKLTVRVQDLGSSPKSAFATVNIIILDVNDESPRFVSVPDRLEVTEDTLPGSVVYSFQGEDNDLDENGTITFGLEPGQGRRYFAIDNATGELSVLTNIDRESTPELTLTVLAEDLGQPKQSSAATVKVTVLDVNDNSPTFYPTYQIVRVAQQTPESRALFQVRAKDFDIGVNAKLTYSWSGGYEPSYVSLNASTGEVFLRDGRRLPRRSEELTFTATDGGGRRSKENSTFLLVPSSPVDIGRDDAVSAVFEFSLEEDSSSLARSTREVGQVTLGTAGGGEFKILDGDPNEAFAIDAHSGLLSAVGKLDRETQSSYDLTVAYFADEATHKILSARVVVTVTDRNDNQPVFTDDDIDGFSVDLRDPIGAHIYRGRVSDADEGRNGKLRYEIIAGNSHGLFRVNADNGVISLAKTLRSANAVLPGITVSVTDHGSPPLSSSRSYSVSVTSTENWHTPTFDFDHYEISLSENTLPNSIVMKLKAVDEDLGKNGEVTYTVENGATELFDVFPDGQLYLKAFLDREETAFYSVTVAVRDGGHPVRSSSAVVVIYVTDENDNPPLFDSKNYVFELSENQPAGTIIGRVSASDEDIGRNAELVFGFAIQNDYFSIDPSTGFITSEVPIDREEFFQQTGQDYFQVDGTVSDNGVLALSDSASINIVIVDINDHRPEFTEESYEVELSENSRLGTEVLRVHANDKDKNENGKVVYALEAAKDGKDILPLEIDEQTGVITLKETLDREAEDSFEVMVVARDLGSPVSLSSSAMIAVKVIDENDQAPKFPQSSLTIKLSELTPLGETVHKFEAKDSDAGANGRVNYFLGGTAQRDAFHLDSNTGILTLSSQLDRELRGRISLVVSAVDGGVPALTSSASITVDVLDENDNAPTFPTTTYLVNVQEGIPVGSNIFKVTASDADAGENGQFDFSLIGTEDFTINPKTGELFTKVPMDREATPSYEFRVAVTDHGLKPLRSEKAVTVVVEDANDHAPEFTSLTSAVVLPGARQGTVIMEVEAKDLDAGSNGAVTYDFGAGGDSFSGHPYDLNRRNGRLTLTRSVALPDRDPVYLEVIAKDEAVQSARKSATTTLTLIGGRNEPGPAFTSELYRVSVKENSPSGTPVGSVHLESASPNAKFYLVGCDSEKGQYRDLFVVDATSGQVRTKRPVDREEEGDLVVLQIIAIDGDGMSGCKMEVNVLDENDSAPEFDDDIKISLSEAFLPGQHLAHIRAVDKDLNPQLKYSLHLKSQAYMSVDETSGSLKLIQSVDREEFEFFDVSVTVTDGVHTTNWTKRLEVEDMNDNAPVFARTHFSFDVSESATRGAIVGRIEARDLDKEANFRQVSYSLVSDWGSDTFSIDPNSGVITLSSATGLDFEDQQHYVLIAQASDSGNPPLTATCTVYINVIDLNDNAPVVSNAVYEAAVKEDVPVGTNILNIEATDADSVSENNLSYELDAMAAKHAFGISENGTIFTTGSLDRERDPFYTFKVTVRDDTKDSSRGHSATCMVQVAVDDVNDFAPEIELPPLNRLSLVENSPPNTAIARIAASDRDQGPNAELHYFLEDSLNMKFSIGRIDGILRSVVSLDREEMSEYELSVKVVDNGQPRLSSKVDIRVKVEDLNDNVPRFNPRYYNTRVLENASIGMDVIATKAFDEDEGKNGRIRYAIIAGNSEGDFAIGEYSGIIRVNKRLDYERKNLYDLTVQAEDQGTENSKYDTASVTIAVSDVNDCAPMLVNSPYRVLVMENASPSTISQPIFVVSARDRDDAPYNRMEYSLRDNRGGAFNINATTGELFASGTLDRETVAEYSLEVTATDFGTPRLSSSGTVLVVVADVNDNSPRFESDFYAFSVAENSPDGTVVGIAKATDKDEGNNARIRYSFESAMPETPFSIDEATGEITVSTTRGHFLDRERTDHFELHVVATDLSDFVPLSSKCNVTVTISDENDSAPSVDNDSTDFFIPPTTVEGSFVLGVLASDQDLGRNGDLFFSLIGGRDDRLFEIDSSNGVVTASRDFTQKISYQILVRVSDNGERRLTAEKKFDIFLAKDLDVPTFGPSFKDTLRLEEDIPTGSVVASVDATESNVAFGIAGGNTYDTFVVHNETGEIIVKRELDYETLTYFELWIKVHYHTKPLFFHAKKITIAILDKNDNPPMFRDIVSRISVVEGLYPPFKLTELIAYDQDEGPNGEIGFEIVPSNEPEEDGMFKVEKSTGVLLCNKELDREKVSEFQLKVLAFDYGSPSLSSTATVLLTVEDLNDNAPLFTRLYSVNVTENTPPGTKLLTVETNDLDTPENANVTYTLLDDNSGGRSAFDIAPFSGLITVTGKLDREVRDEYALKVQASDGAWKLDTTISVLVQDENDNIPVFDHDLYEFTFPYSFDKEQDDLVRSLPQVGRVHALDRDAPGPNSALVYSLSHRSEFFALDSQSGIIKVKSKLPFNRRTDSKASEDNIYQLRVLATDLGSPPRSSECEVRISVVGGNEHAPDFSKDTRRELALPRSLPLGSVVTTVSATDAESPADSLEYGIIGPEEAKNLFDINSRTGAIKTRRSLSGLAGLGEIRLNVSVTDRGIPRKSSFTTIALTFSGANEHAPEFQSPTTRIYIREDEPIGNTIVTISATDKDSGPNGKLAYDIVKGDPQGMFRVDRDSGQIMVNQSLDYEKIPVYNIVVEARDLGYYSRSSTASVKIVLQDVNDNLPLFDEAAIKASVKENAPVGTMVTQVIAIDHDSPKHGQVVYSFVDKQEEFEIDPDTGIVVTLRSFDFESVSAYRLTVEAKNPGAEESAQAILHITIKGENEFMPKFRQPVFQFAVSEASTVGSTIGKVEADDADAGEEGVISYFFVGASNAAGFGIDHQTGVLFVNERLDRESQNRYVLTVLAKNKGSIRGNDIDEAQVIIQVQDGNDPPVFRREFYSAEIPEDATVGTEVVAVSAVDKDVRPRNSHFSYSLAAGDDDDGKFSIDSSSGLITVVGRLDRETHVEGYNLTVNAIDNGSPPATGSATVLVTLEDVNDSPPMLKETVGQIKENSPVGSFIMQLDAKDADLAPNAGPFHFELIQGQDKVELDKVSGALTSKLIYDRERIPDFRVKVQIRDSGRPPLTSVGNIRVEVLDENDNPSAPRNLNVVIKTHEGVFPGGRIADIRPSDPDLKGDYVCDLLRGSESIFRVEHNCQVTAGRIKNGREYELVVSASDGRHDAVQVAATLNFVQFSPYALEQAVVVRIKSDSPDKVLGFFRATDNGGGRLMDLLSLSKSTDGNIDCLLALKENDLVLPRSEALVHVRQRFERDGGGFFGAENVHVDYNPCNDAPCKNLGYCSSSMRLLNVTDVAEYDDTVFNSPRFEQSVKCQCGAQFAGAFCEIQKNPCDPSPCLYDGQCIQDADGGRGFECLCPPLRGGRRCEKRKTNVCAPNPCLSGGTCQKNKDGDDFFCLCRPGYQGERCQLALDSCRSNPCLNGGTCVSLKPNYRCRCPDNYYGNHCELSTFGFDELSHAAFPQLDANTNDISVIFTTTKSNALLVYNYGRSVGGRSDFLAVELVEGAPRLSWGGTRTAIKRIELDRKVDTGRWFKLTATRNNQVGTLSIEDCTESGEFCKVCKPDDPNCFRKAVGEAGTLTFHGNPMYFAGVPAGSGSLFVRRSEQISSLDFVGCVKSLSINGHERRLIGDALNATGIRSSCNQVDGGACGRGDECGLFGTCVPLWSHHKCECGNVVAPDCGPSFTPFSLTEEQEVHFYPTDKYRRTVALGKSNLNSGYWKRDLSSARGPDRGLSLAFRTLKNSGVLFTAVNGFSSTVLEVDSSSRLIYRSNVGGSSKPEINMTSTGVTVDDGQWHRVSLEIIDGGTALAMRLDGQRVGYEIEYSAAHDFLEAGIDRFVIGMAGGEKKGFRGCVANFTINDELQTIGDSNGGQTPLLRADVPAGVHVDGCDLQILQSVASKDAVDVGITVIIVFFVLLICAIALSFTYFKLKKRYRKQKESQAAEAASTTKGGVYDGGYSNRGLDLQESASSRQLHQLNNATSLVTTTPSGASSIQYKPKMRPTMIGSHDNKPDLLDTRQQRLSSVSPLAHQHQHQPVNHHLNNASPAAMMDGGGVEDHYNEPVEHYDLENASSIAPSDIDVIYHYKGYRDGSGGGSRHRYSGGKSLNSRKRANYLKHQNTPLARLSPSSEMSHNNPRHILTLGDLSGKPLPHTALLESERSLNSPVSHISGASSRSRSRHSPARHLGSSGGSRGLTSENVARFNHHQRAAAVAAATAQQQKSSTLVNTLDMVSLGSESRKNKTPTVDVDNSSATSSSSSGDSDNDNDSFTCSEYEYDSAGGGALSQPDGVKDIADSSLGAMVFSKLMGKSAGGKETEEEEDDEELEDVAASASAMPGKTWESLLNWQPDYTSFAGVFRDIAELPHTLQAGDAHTLPAEMHPPPLSRDGFRPAPVGLDRQFGGGDNAEEQYI